jgi:hypothetical protein
VSEKKTPATAGRVIRIVLRALAVVLAPIILALLVLQVPRVQSWIAQKAVAFISGKTHTRIEVGSLSIAFSHTLVLRDLFVEDLRGDTLLSVRTLAADINLLGLLSHAVIIHNVRIDSLTAHITRTLPDSAFNFGFILKALGPAATTDVRPDTPAGPAWEIRPEGMSLHGMTVSYEDEVSGLNLRFRIGSLETAVDKFDLDGMRFHVDKLSVENTMASVIRDQQIPISGSGRYRWRMFILNMRTGRRGNSSALTSEGRR